AFAGEATPAQGDLADRLERALFARGVVCTVIDVPALEDGTRSPRLIADIASQCLEAGLVTILSASLPRLAERHELSARVEPGALLTIGDEVPITPDDPEAVEAVIAALVQRGVLS